MNALTVPNACRRGDTAYQRSRPASALGVDTRTTTAGECERAVSGEPHLRQFIATNADRHAFAVKPGSDLFALHRWKPERQQIIVGVAGRGALQSAARIGFSKPNPPP